MRELLQLSSTTGFVEENHNDNDGLTIKAIVSSDLEMNDTGNILPTHLRCEKCHERHF